MTDPLFVDCYQGDGPKDWTALAVAGAPWHGVILKATQGTYYNPRAWYLGEMAKVAAVPSERKGVDWFFGAYHYLDMSQDGAAQADFYLSCAGDDFSQPGALWPIVDVERGGQRAPSLTKQRVIDTTSAFAARILAVTGKTPTLYGGSLLADLGITDHMGCGRLWIARYTPTLPHDVISRIGWSEPWLWQYCGDGEASLAGYPNQAPGCGKVDISVLTRAGGIAGLVHDLASSA
jgi:GH25 family lysozyme M1 (1,4-beta-N-acetylmuramidase)